MTKPSEQGGDIRENECNCRFEPTILRDDVPFRALSASNRARIAERGF
jgi:hypothetical protein